MSETELPPVAASPAAVRDRRIILGLILLVLACYWPVGTFNFINYDDTRYITDNQDVQQGFNLHTLKYAFTSADGGYWHPLTWITHLVDVELYGPKISGHPWVGILLQSDQAIPAGHHFTNLLFHMADTLLLWVVLKRMTGAVWPSAWVAAMFAVHPMHVESVAWVSERKDVLSGFFFLLTLMAYHRYTEQMTAKRYGLMLLAFIAALMSKPTTVTTPFVLLLLDIWPLQRIRFGPDFWRTTARPIVEKLPLLALSAVLCVVTVLSARTIDTVLTLAQVPLKLRLETVFVSYARYLGKLVWPTHLSIYYPYPAAWPMGLVIGSIALVAVLTAVAALEAKRRPYLLVGWLWFTGMLVPVIGLVMTGDASLADRYTFIPYIGLFFAIAWLGTELLARSRDAMIGAGAVTVIVCAIFTYHQVWNWQNSLTIMGHALAVTTDNAPANTNYACALTDYDRDAEAAPYFKEAVRLRPDNLLANVNYGRLLLNAGKLEQAIPYLKTAGRLDPNDWNYLTQVARVQDMKGNHLDAIRRFQFILEQRPRSIEAETCLANSLLYIGQLDEAETHFRRALELEPHLARAYHKLGLIAEARQNPSEAIDDFKTALEMQPKLGVVHLDYGVMLAKIGDYNGAIQELTNAAQFLADDAYTERTLAEMTFGKVLEKIQRPMDAAEHFVKAIDLANLGVAKAPGELAPQYQLAMTLKQIGREDEALAAAQKAMDIAAEHSNVYYVGELLKQFPGVKIPASAMLPSTRPSTNPSAGPSTRPSTRP